MMITQLAKIIGISCLSGGSGKTSTSLNLAKMLSANYGKTLAIDFDPQGNLSQWNGWHDLSQTATISETLLPHPDQVSLAAIIQPVVNDDQDSQLSIAPSDYSLTHAADAISMQPGRELALHRAIKDVRSTYDFIVIDSPPSKGILTYNVILAADYLVIPTECTHKGVTGAVNTVILVQELQALDFNVPKILGVLPTRDQWAGPNRTRMSQAALTRLQEVLPDLHLFPPVKHSTIVQQTNNMGWSLAEADATALAQPFQAVIDSLFATGAHV